jgi:hypothetical protein
MSYSLQFASAQKNWDKEIQSIDYIRSKTLLYRPKFSTDLFIMLKTKFMVPGHYLADFNEIGKNRFSSCDLKLN